jgi:hypothetical protein
MVQRAFGWNVIEKMGFARAQPGLERDGFSSNRHLALGYCCSMMFSDLPSPAEALSQTTTRARGFAQAGNRYPPRIKCGAGFFGIMLWEF